MTTRVRRLMVVAAAAVLVGAAVGACSSSEQPTPIIVILTPAPKPSATPTPTATPEPSPSESASASASSSASASASASAVATATPVPGGGFVGVENCTGSSTIKAFFTEVASKVTWAVYCGHMPSGWGVIPNGLHYELPSSGSFMTGQYSKTGGGSIIIKEGKYGTDICSTSSTGSLGTASFGSMSGAFHSIPGGFAICLNPGSKSAYEISGTGVSQAAFTSIAANLALIPKT